MKGSKKGFSEYINQGKRRLLLNGSGDPVAKDVEKTEVLSAFSASFFAGKTSLQESQDPGNPTKVQGKEGLLEEDQVRKHLNRLDRHKLMGPHGLHPMSAVGAG